MRLRGVAGTFCQAKASWGHPSPGKGAIDNFQLQNEKQKFLGQLSKENGQLSIQRLSSPCNPAGIFVFIRVHLSLFASDPPNGAKAWPVLPKLRKGRWRRAFRC